MLKSVCPNTQGNYDTYKHTQKKKKKCIKNIICHSIKTYAFKHASESNTTALKKNTTVERCETILKKILINML